MKHMRLKFIADSSGRTQKFNTADTVPKPATGHDIQPVPSPILTTYFSTIQLNDIFPSPSA